VAGSCEAVAKVDVWSQSRHPGGVGMRSHWVGMERRRWISRLEAPTITDASENQPLRDNTVRPDVRVLRLSIAATTQRAETALLKSRLDTRRPNVKNEGVLARRIEMKPARNPSGRAERRRRQPRDRSLSTRPLLRCHASISICCGSGVRGRHSIVNPNGVRPGTAAGSIGWRGGLQTAT